MELIGTNGDEYVYVMMSIDDYNRIVHEKEKDEYRRGWQDARDTHEIGADAKE